MRIIVVLVASVVIASGLAACGGPRPPYPQGPTPSASVNPETGTRGGSGM